VISTQVLQTSAFAVSVPTRIAARSGVDQALSNIEHAVDYKLHADTDQQKSHDTRKGIHAVGA
jgi:hypothetical protein